MGNRRNGRRPRTRAGPISRGVTRRRLIGAGTAALAGASLLYGTEGYSLVTAARGGATQVANDGNEPVDVDLAPYVVAGGGSMDLVTVTNGMDRDLTVSAALDDPGQGTTSPPATIPPSGSTTLTVDVPVSETDESGVLPFSVSAASGTGFDVELPRSVPIYGVSRVIEDRSQNSNANYQVTYRVEGFPDFASLEVEFDDRSNDWADETFAPSGRQGSFSYQSGGTEGDTFDVTFTAYDGGGAVILQQTMTDVADGQDPPGNHDLSTPSSPTLESFTLTDTTQWNTTHYEVEYEVANTADFQRVEVTFEDTEPGKSWATKTETNTSSPTGTVTYEQGGTEGDEYEVTVDVVDTNGFVVDSGTVTDVAGGNNTVSWP